MIIGFIRHNHLANFIEALIHFKKAQQLSKTS